MKVSIIADEMYPFYVINQSPVEGWRPVVEVPDELVERFESVCTELYKLLEEVSQYYTRGESK